MTTTGQRLGNYILGDPIGRSGLALVHRGEHAATGRPVMIKIIHRYFAADSEALQAFLQELVAVRRLRHPNIVNVEDFGMDGSTAWLALERVEGANLKDAPQPPYPPEVASEIASQVAAALKFAHEHGILHRNIKPSNIFVTPDGTVRLSDFGMATLGASVHPLMKSGLTTPLPAFMSPEQSAGDPLTPRSDTYSLGVLAYWMLTGQPPFPGDTPETVLARQQHAAPVAPSHLAPDLTREMDAAVLKALSPFLPARYATPAEFAGALRLAVGPTGPELLAEAFSGGDAPGALHGAVVPQRYPEDAGLSKVERAFERIWRPAKVDPYRTLKTVAAVGTVAVAFTGWTWWYSFSPLPSLPPAESALTVEAAAGTWPSYRRDVNRTGADPSADPKFRGDVRWTFRTNEPFLASPVAVGDFVYIPTGGDRRIVALDAATGALRWQAPTTGPVDSTPAIVEDNLYVGLRDGRLLCLDRFTGATRWEFDSKNPILSSPVVSAGTVFFGSGDSRIYAVDAATGELRWSFETAGWVVSSPAVWRNLVIVGSRDGWVYFLDENNGARVFYFHTGAAVEADPAVADDRVYIGNEGRRFWAFKTTERSSPMDRRIYAVHAQLFIWGLSPPPPRPKGVLWVRRAGGRFVVGAAIGPAGVYAGNEDGKLYAWSRDGADLWQFKAGGPILSAPTLVGSTLYFGSDDGKLYALDAESGQQRWSFRTEGRVRSSPAVTPDGIYVASQDGTLYALR